MSDHKHFDMFSRVKVSFCSHRIRGMVPQKLRVYESEQKELENVLKLLVSNCGFSYWVKSLALIDLELSMFFFLAKESKNRISELRRMK